MPASFCRSGTMKWIFLLLPFPQIFKNRTPSVSFFKTTGLNLLSESELSRPGAAGWPSAVGPLSESDACRSECSTWVKEETSVKCASFREEEGAEREREEGGAGRRSCHGQGGTAMSSCIQLRGCTAAKTLQCFCMSRSAQWCHSLTEATGTVEKSDVMM